MQKIGFIGLGIMGAPMAGHILKGGYPLTVYNRTHAKTADLATQGANVAMTPKAVAENSDLIVVIVSRSADVEAVLFGEEGLSKADLKGKIIVDMSTIEPSEAIRFAKEMAKMGAQMIDAPVSGGDVGAKNATLTIMAGGDKTTFNRCLPIFELMGKKINYMGVSGTGQATKMCNQIMVTASLMGVCEGLAMAKVQGLDLEKVREVVLGGVGASAQLEVVAPKIIAGDDSPGFFVELMAKDLGIVKAAQAEKGLPSQVVELGLAQMKQLMSQGHGKLGTQSIARNFGPRG